MDSYSQPWQQPLAYLVRHGETEHNSDNCFRGWDDPPLNEEGVRAAEMVANFFSYERIGRVVSSDLARAMQTAQYILESGSVLSPYLSTDFNLRPWNIAGFAGQEKNAANLKKIDRYVQNPDLVVPDGESLDNFRKRSEDAIMGYLGTTYDGLPTVIVWHTSGLTALHCLIYDCEAQPDDLIEPGGIIALYVDAQGKMSMVPRMGEVQTEVKPQAS